MKFSILDFRLRGKKQIGNFDSLANFGHRPMLSRPGAPPQPEEKSPKERDVEILTFALGRQPEKKYNERGFQTQINFEVKFHFLK